MPSILLNDCNCCMQQRGSRVNVKVMADGIMYHCLLKKMKEPLLRMAICEAPLSARENKEISLNRQCKHK